MNKYIRGVLIKNILDEIRYEEDRKFLCSLELGEETSYEKHTKVCGKCCYNECLTNKVPERCPFMTEHLVLQ